MMDSMIIVRGGGDMATAVIHRLWRAGFRVLVLETDKPAAIRRQVAVSEAVYDGSATVEGMTAVRVDSLSRCDEAKCRYMWIRKASVFTSLRLRL